MYNFEIPTITFCISSNNNLRYLKLCIASIRNNAYNKNHPIIVFIDRDNDGSIEWLNNNQTKYNIQYFINPDLNKKKFGIAKAYDFCIEQSQTDIFWIFHADMVLGKNADYHAYKHLTKRGVVCATRIEPPIFPNGGEKIIHDFSIWPENFNSPEFDNKVIEYSQLYDTKTTQGIFAPWMMYKTDFIALGGHDHQFGSCKEDSDLFNRMKINDFKLIQSWSSLVYHFTGRGFRFEDDILDHSLKNQEIRIAERKFIRKWGSTIKSNHLLDPIVEKKYNIALVPEFLDIKTIEQIEPFFDKIYLSNHRQLELNNIQDVECKNNIAFIEKTNIIPDLLAEDIVTYIDKISLTDQDYYIINNIHNIITEINQVGSFDVNGIKIHIKRIHNVLEKYKI